MIEFKEVVHYSKTDVYFGGDYREIEIFMNGDLVASYGDHYHDKGREKADGFYDAISIVLETGTWTWFCEAVADYEC
jgi:hypothetical protein